MIKLIAMDLDWTLIDHSKNVDQRIGKELVDKLNDFIKKGNYAGIVSGRVLWDFELEFERAGVLWANPFPNYVVSREAYIYDIENKDFVSFDEYNLPTKKKVVNFNSNLSLYIPEMLSMYERENVYVGNFITYGDFALEIHVKQADTDKAMNLMERFVKEKKIVDAAVHRNCTAITIYNKNAGKGKTLMAAVKHFGIKPEEVLAIGDNYNDVSMIDGKLGFIGACVGNADDNLKKIVKAGGGYVGEGMAWRGILNVLEQLKKDGLME